MTIAKALLSEIGIQQTLYREEADWARVQGRSSISPERRLAALRVVERIARDTLPQGSADLDDILIATTGAKNECFYLSTRYLRPELLSRIGG